MRDWKMLEIVLHQFIIYNQLNYKNIENIA